MDFQFWAIWAAQGRRRFCFNYELLPTFLGDFLCFHGPKIHSKGQLISKGLFDKLNSSKNRTKKFDSGRLVFVRFLEEFEDTKKTFRN